MNLRNEPEASALMAAETAADHRQHIERATGRTANATDRYMGHFLGPKGAADFLGAMAAGPNQGADRIIPPAAASNCLVFYAENGMPRSLSGIYYRFVRQINDDTGRLPITKPVMMAGAANWK